MPKITDDLWKQRKANDERRAAHRREFEQEQHRVQHRMELQTREATTLDELLEKLGAGEGTEVIFTRDRK